MSSSSAASAAPVRTLPVFKNTVYEFADGTTIVMTSRFYSGRKLVYRLNLQTEAKTKTVADFLYNHTEAKLKPPYAKMSVEFSYKPAGQPSIAFVFSSAEHLEQFRQLCQIHALLINRGFSESSERTEGSAVTLRYLFRNLLDMNWFQTVFFEISDKLTTDRLKCEKVRSVDLVLESQFIQEIDEPSPRSHTTTPNQSTPTSPQILRTSSERILSDLGSSPSPRFHNNSPQDRKSSTPPRMFRRFVSQPSAVADPES